MPTPVKTTDRLLDEITYLKKHIVEIEKSVAKYKKIEEKLQFYQKAIDSSSDAIGMSTAEGKHNYQNDTFTKMFGMNVKEVDGKKGPPSTVYVDENVGRDVFKTIMRGDSWIGEVEMLDKEKKKLDIYLRAYSLKDDNDKVIGLVGVHTDITERKKMQSVLINHHYLLEERVKNRTDELVQVNKAFQTEISDRKHAEEQIAIFQKFVNASQEGLGIADLEGNITYANRALCRILDEDKIDESFTNNVRNYYLKEDLSRLENEILPSVIKLGHRTVEIPLLSRKGKLTPTIQSIFLIRDEQGEPLYFANVTTNISRLKHAEEELRKSQAQLIQSEKLSAMGHMAGGLAHELNSPLAGLLPMIENFRNSAKEGSTELSEFSLMLKACEYMAKIVKDFSSFSRESKGEFSEINIKEVIEDTLSFSISRFKKQKVQIVKQYENNHKNIRGEKNEIQQVILNILSNALDAMPEGGKFSVKTHMSKDNSNAIVTFTDNGEGIEKERLTKIFDPFYTTKSPGKGTGLGLSISYKIIEKHGGKISAKSTPGKGTKLTISLPVI